MMTLDEFFTSRTMDLTQAPQLKEATADNSTDVFTTISCRSASGWMTSLPTERARSADDNLRRLARLPNHYSSVFSAFSWSRRDEHQSRMSVTQSQS